MPDNNTRRYQDVPVLCQQCGKPIENLDDMRAEDYYFKFETYHEDCKTVWKFWKILYFLLASIFARGEDESPATGTANAFGRAFYFGMPKWPATVKIRLFIFTLIAFPLSLAFTAWGILAYSEGNSPLGYIALVGGIGTFLFVFTFVRYYLQVWTKLIKKSPQITQEQNSMLAPSAEKILLAAVFTLIALGAIGYSYSGSQAATKGASELGVAAYIFSHYAELAPLAFSYLFKSGELQGAIGSMLFLIIIPYLAAVLVFSFFTKKTKEQAIKRTNAWLPGEQKKL